MLPAAADSSWPRSSPSGLGAARLGRAVELLLSGFRSGMPRTRAGVARQPSGHVPALADPAAGEKFDSGGDGQAGMFGERIEIPVRPFVAEDEHVAFAALHLEAGLHEQRLAA